MERVLIPNFMELMDKTDNIQQHQQIQAVTIQQCNFWTPDDIWTHQPPYWHKHCIWLPQWQHWQTFHLPSNNIVSYLLQQYKLNVNLFWILKNLHKSLPDNLKANHMVKVIQYLIGGRACRLLGFRQKMLAHFELNMYNVY